MTTYYADSSALVKRYVQERGSSNVQAICDRAADNVIAVASIGLVEIAAALGMKVRQKLLPVGTRDGLLRDLQTDGRERYWIVEIDQGLIAEAIALTRQYKLRGYDAVHLASALLLQRTLQAEGISGPVMLSADLDLLDASEAQGLVIENPDA